MEDLAADGCIDVQGYRIPHEVLASVLQRFGISATEGIDGKEQFTLELKCSSSREVTTAVFDPPSKQWQARDVQDAALVLRLSASTALAGLTSACLRDANNLELRKISISDAKDKIAGDWTDELPRTDHVHFLKSRKWENTSLGAMSQWTVSLRLMTHLLMAHPRSAVLLW